MNEYFFPPNMLYLLLSLEILVLENFEVSKMQDLKQKSFLNRWLETQVVLTFPLIFKS